jgi:large subunit ribosomal protein L23
MSLDPYHIIKRPVVTEKTTILEEKENQVVFHVDPRASKHQIKDAIESIFKVKVKKINTMRLRGKPVRRGLVVGRRSHWKKAVVTLAEGQTIDFYQGA